MADVEVIDLEYYPIWDKQPSEPEEKFLLFQGFFLPLPRANLLGAFKRYKEQKGENGQKIVNVPTSWRDDCEKFQWRQRHTSYWRKRNLEDLERRDERIREYHSECLTTAGLLKQRAEEILNNFDLEQSSPKDACQMLRLAKELTEEALSIKDIDKAAMVLFRAGFEISVPEAQWTATSLGEIAQKRLGDTEKSWGKCQGA
jgi:hypothetical protein